ncbi:MAG: hypothetical protein FWH37_02155 [Candidatus Bathyarchaeota archaeon]|nr:hypothetical protein [Candidatus Termiticorpusculum sp.]
MLGFNSLCFFAQTAEGKFIDNRLKTVFFQKLPAEKRVIMLFSFLKRDFRKLPIQFQLL